MKETNYTKLAERAEDIGISMNAYNMVHEGFWDIYWMKPF